MAFISEQFEKIDWGLVGLLAVGVACFAIISLTT